MPKLRSGLHLRRYEAENNPLPWWGKSKLGRFLQNNGTTPKHLRASTILDEVRVRSKEGHNVEEGGSNVLNI